jgi:hypothetical protein
MKRPMRCNNCGTWFMRVYSSQSVCCVDWHGPRWIDDPIAAEKYKVYREWLAQLQKEKTR